MRKNIVVSMLIIALAAALLGGATFAWFTDSEPVDADFTAGTLTLGDMSSQGVIISDIAPGFTEDWDITIENTGSLKMYYRLYFASTITKDSATIEVEKMKVSLLDATGNTVIQPDVVIDTVDSNNPWFDLSMSLDAAGGANDVIAYIVRFELPTETDDIYQGAEWDITLHVDATQYDYQDHTLATNIEW